MQVEVYRGWSQRHCKLKFIQVEVEGNAKEVYVEVEFYRRQCKSKFIGAGVRGTVSRSLSKSKLKAMQVEVYRAGVGGTVSQSLSKSKLKEMQVEVIQVRVGGTVESL
jgi:hypothetical protein